MLITVDDRGNMLIAEAQREVRTIYRRGVPGQAVAATIWTIAAACATWGSFPFAVGALVIGGVLIFPLTVFALRVSSRPTKLAAGNPFRRLAIESAFVLPLSMPLVAPTTAYRHGWFFPSMMILVGAHYLTFATLYGMRTFLVLAAALVGGGLLIASTWPDRLAVGGWVAAGMLAIFAGYESSNRWRRK